MIIKYFLHVTGGEMLPVNHNIIKLIIIIAKWTDIKSTCPRELMWAASEILWYQGLSSVVLFDK